MADSTATTKIVIKHRHTDTVLYEYQPTEDEQASGLAMRAALEAGVRVGANLDGANLVGANLDGANLRGANLDGANLVGANLVGANLRGANLRGANLDGANLGGAYLGGANLDGANLDGANLGGANLGGANLDGAYLGGANLGGANLGGANLDGANLGGANLRGANLGGANLAGDAKLIGERPVFILGPIGSRSDYFTAYLTDKGLRLRAGCFFGTRDEFVAKLNAEHGGNVHGAEYRAALRLIAVHAELWTPKDAEASLVAEVAEV